MWPSNHLCNERPALDLLLQRFSHAAVPNNEQLVFSCFIDIVEYADIIVLKGRGGLSFVDKALLGFGIKG